MIALYKKFTPALSAIFILFGLKTELKATQITPSAQRLDISGAGSYVRVGNFVTLGINRIDHYINPSNYHGATQSGTLYLQLWTCLTPFNGLQTSLGYKVAEATLAPLMEGDHYSNVSTTVPFSAPPDGTYYMVMVLAEIDSFHSHHAPDDYQPPTMDWFNFSNTETFGYIPPPPVAPHPSITAQPKSITAVTGSSARFSVTATGENLTYQWNKNGSPIKGATGSSFGISSVKASDSGNYTVSVTDTAKMVTSTVAKLTVNAPKVTSNLAEVTLKQGKLMIRYTVTTNFGAKSFSAKNLPAGLKLDATTGVVSGKPSKKGTYTVTFTAAKKQGSKVIQSKTAKKVFKVN